MKKTAANALTKLFLIVYGIILVAHIWEMGFDSWQVLAALFAGCALAFVAHKRHGPLPLIFLLIHMTIEWYFHAMHGAHYSNGEILFHALHACFDFVFLYLESGVHYKKYRPVIMMAITLFLAVIFYVSFVPPVQVAHFSPLYAHLQEMGGLHDAHEHHSESILHPLVLGGILGCVLSHLLYQRKQKH